MTLRLYKYNLKLEQYLKKSARLRSNKDKIISMKVVSLAHEINLLPTFWITRQMSILKVHLFLFSTVHFPTILDAGGSNL